MRWKIILLIGTVFNVGGCATQPEKVMTPLEIQTMQSRDYTADPSIVFSSIISVLQDLGYINIRADKSTGLISAESTAKSNKFVNPFLVLATEPSKSVFLSEVEVKQTKVTAFIEKIANTTKVRLSFVNTHNTSTGNGQNYRKDDIVLDADAYQNAFERIESEIFLRAGQS